ncbi:GNAT family N-acetyltransferase [Flavisolibacter sp. BT320]|nr:GNAT family N-acetyltransferase [Flavisolibacter longurius]
MLFPNFTPFPAMQTGRLLLRQMRLSDAPALHKLRSNKDVMQYINRPLTQTLEEAEGWVNVIIDAVSRNEGITWAICLKESPDEHVGNIGIWRIDKANHRGEVGYMLDPSLQGRGIMYEAIQPVISYGFEQLGLHSLEAQIDPRNQASAALLRKAGFVQEGYFRQNCFHNGSFTDTAVYSLLSSQEKTAKEDIPLTKAGAV